MLTQTALSSSVDTEAWATLKPDFHKARNLSTALFYFQKTDMEFTQTTKAMYCDFMVESFYMIPL